MTTGHNPNKVLLGATRSSSRGISSHPGDASTFKAGLAVRRNDGELSLATGSLLGISLGRDLSRTDHVAVLRVGLDAPILLTDDSNDYAYAVPGQPVRVGNDGRAVAAGGTLTGAIYVTGKIDGIDPRSKETGAVAMIDLPGGL